MSENKTSVTSEHDVGAAAKARPGGVMHATDGLLILAIPAYLYVWTGRRAA